MLPCDSIRISRTTKEFSIGTFAEFTPSTQVGFHLSDALPDAVTLCLSKCRRNRQKQLADPVDRDVAAQVEQVKPDAPALQALDDLVRRA